MPGSKTAADYADALRIAHEDYRAGRVTRGELLDRTKAIWLEVLERDLVDEVHAEIDRSGEV